MHEGEEREEDIQIKGLRAVQVYFNGERF
jgi:hypothetical protein